MVRRKPKVFLKEFQIIFRIEREPYEILSAYAKKTNHRVSEVARLIVREFAHFIKNVNEMNPEAAINDFFNKNVNVYNFNNEKKDIIPLHNVYNFNKKVCSLYLNETIFEEIRKLAESQGKSISETVNYLLYKTVYSIKNVNVYEINRNVNEINKNAQICASKNTQICDLCSKNLASGVIIYTPSGRAYKTCIECIEKRKNHEKWRIETMSNPNETEI